MTLQEQLKKVETDLKKVEGKRKSLQEKRKKILADIEEEMPGSGLRKIRRSLILFQKISGRLQTKISSSSEK